MLSYTEENYLKAIYHLSGGGVKAVTTNDIAEAMNTKAASVTDMVKKLNAKSLLTHEPYYGVTLTEKGRASALSVVRKHRLWETFLVQKLNFSWDEVHEIAEQLEHIQSTVLIERLDTFLGYPKLDPHGDPIPDSKGRFKAGKQVSLDQVQPGYEGTIAAVKDSDSNLLKFLAKVGAQPGSAIRVISKEHFDDSMEIEVNHAKRVFVSRDVSQNILVAP
jgi:DtxR family Mn-dependent transcriptional regulator